MGLNTEARRHRVYYIPAGGIKKGEKKLGTKSAWVLGISYFPFSDLPDFLTTDSYKR
jgi:hypothetical protein